MACWLQTLNVLGIMSAQQDERERSICWQNTRDADDGNNTTASLTPPKQTELREEGKSTWRKCRWDEAQSSCEEDNTPLEKHVCHLFKGQRQEVWGLWNKIWHCGGAGEVTSQVWTVIHSRSLKEEGSTRPTEQTVNLTAWGRLKAKAELNNSRHFTGFFIPACWPTNWPSGLR